MCRRSGRAPLIRRLAGFRWPSTAPLGYPFRAECEKATLELDNRRLRVMSDLGGERVITEKPLARQAVWTNAWLAELFVNWLRGGQVPPNTVEDNLQCCALLFAAIESAHSGRVVHVQDFLRSNMKAVESAAAGDVARSHDLEKE